jgi:hypothetical protein
METILFPDFNELQVTHIISGEKSHPSVNLFTVLMILSYVIQM